MGVRREAENVLDNMYYGPTGDAYSPPHMARTAQQGIVWETDAYRSCNNIKESGVCMGYHLTNSPNDNWDTWCFLITFNHYNTYLYQIWIPFSNYDDPPIYARTCRASTWKSWYQIH